VGKRFLRTIVQEPTILGATGDITPVDLPVNPLSAIYLTLFIEEPVQQAALGWTLLSDYYAALSDLSIRHKGEMIVQGNLQDIMMVNGVAFRQWPFGTHLSGIGNLRAMTFPICLGRKPFDHNEAFPATSRGNLRFHMNVLDFTPGTATQLQWALEAVELIEDDPKQYIKYTTNTRVLAATGRQRVPLPIGNELVGCLLFDPATEITTAEAFAWGKVKVMVDNVEQYYAESNWESLRQSLCAHGHLGMNDLGHVHAQAAADTVTSDEQKRLNEPPHQYAYLDFDPLNDESYLLETAGHSDVELDMNSDVSSGTARYLPIELVRVRQ
jgi:hypothetical protein